MSTVIEMDTGSNPLDSHHPRHSYLARRLGLALPVIPARLTSAYDRKIFYESLTEYRNLPASASQQDLFDGNMTGRAILKLTKIFNRRVTTFYSSSSNLDYNSTHRRSHKYPGYQIPLHLANLYKSLQSFYLRREASQIYDIPSNDIQNLLAPDPLQPAMRLSEGILLLIIVYCLTFLIYASSVSTRPPLAARLPLQQLPQQGPAPPSLSQSTLKFRRAVNQARKQPTIPLQNNSSVSTSHIRARAQRSCIVCRHHFTKGRGKNTKRQEEWLPLAIQCEKNLRAAKAGRAGCTFVSFIVCLALCISLLITYNS